MRTIVMDAKVEIQLPDVIDPIGYSEEMYARRPRIRMDLCYEVNDLVLHLPDGRTVTVKRVMLQKILGTIIPVVEGDQVVMFKVTEADEPIRVEGGT